MDNGPMQPKIDLLRSHVCTHDDSDVWVCRSERKFLTGEWISRADFQELQAAMEEKNETQDWWGYSDTRPLAPDAHNSITKLIGGKSYTFRGKVHE